MSVTVGTAAWMIIRVRFVSCVFLCGGGVWCFHCRLPAFGYNLGILPNRNTERRKVGRRCNFERVRKRRDEAQNERPVVTYQAPTKQLAGQGRAESWHGMMPKTLVSNRAPFFCCGFVHRRLKGKFWFSLGSVDEERSQWPNEEKRWDDVGRNKTSSQRNEEGFVTGHVVIGQQSPRGAVAGSWAISCGSNWCHT